MSTKMFMLRASCLVSCPKPTLALNSRTVGKENNPSFELKHGLGNLSLRRPLTYPEGRHNPDSPCKRPKPALNSRLIAPSGDIKEGTQ